MHPDPVGGDDALRGLQRLRGRVHRSWAPVLVGTLANLVGSWIAYAVGYYGRIDLIEKHGGKLHIKPSHLDVGRPLVRALRRAPTVFFSRMLPIVRTFISLPAGVARMPFWRFTVFTRSAACRGCSLLTVIGREARRQLGGLEGLAALRRLRGRRADRRRDRLPRRAPRPARPRAGQAAPAPDASAPTRAPAAPRRRARAPPRARPSCCRSRPRATSALVPLAARLALRRRSTASCARPSRSRCTPGRPPRCSSRCATRSPRPLRGLDRAPARRCVRRLVPAARRSPGWPSSGRSSSAWARPRRSPSACWPARRPGAGPTRDAARAGARDAARTPGWPTRCGSGWPRPARSIPGASRNGMTLAAARAARLRAPGRERALAPRGAAGHRRRDRAEGRRGWPGAACRAPVRPAFAAGTAAAFASTLGSTLR